MRARGVISTEEIRYLVRTRNKSSFYGQNKLDDNLNYTIDYCYKITRTPSDYQQATELPEAYTRQEAKNVEMTALIDIETIELVPRPKDSQIVG